MKRLVVGMLAHVDAGKTTLSEGLLYTAGALRRLGRVDHGDAFLDTHGLERERGITIFSKQALLQAGDTILTLLDTPGHVDFSSEMERAIQVMDYAILVISGSDGVQSHTETLWRLLERYNVPVFVFVNKMDLAITSRAELLKELRQRLSGACMDFSMPRPALDEEIAMCSESLMETYLEKGFLEDKPIVKAIQARKLFPVYFGAALKLEGIQIFLQGFLQYARQPVYGDSFGARVYKVTHDGGARLTWMKITGGVLRAKDVLSNRSAATVPDDLWEEKADQLRLYDGAKYTSISQAEAGTLCAVTGLTHTRPGQGLGVEVDDKPPLLEPVLTYRLLFPPETNLYDTFGKLKQLQEEDPQLHLTWDEANREIHAQLMGEIHKEVLERLIAQRYGLIVSFGPGAILYKETISEPVEGFGHYEPLRHYAHVHLRLEPGPPGSGVVLNSQCPEDVLARNWQRLILTHLAEKQHLGVLTGAPITDVRITLLDGQAHLKHTEGGDFRQATYRAVRQGLMQANSVLLEPYYKFRLELPEDSMGKAMSDLQRMDCEFQPMPRVGSYAILAGNGPVAALGAYARQVASYTRGRGKLSLIPDGYRPCKNPESIIKEKGYDPERDLDNTPDSVFCSHGAGITVKWDQVSARCGAAQQSLDGQRTASPSPGQGKVKDEEAELTAIFQRTYGPVKDRTFLLRPKPSATTLSTDAMLQATDPAESYLLVDGYNIIYAWEDLRALAREGLHIAREALIRLLTDYQGYHQCNLILVFDAYKVTGGEERVEKQGGIYLVYTREAEIADVYIERVTAKLGPNRHVRVATSDGLEQLIVLGKGALRVPASAFRREVDQSIGEVRAFLEKLQVENQGSYSIWEKMKTDC